MGFTNYLLTGMILQVWKYSNCRSHYITNPSNVLSQGKSHSKIHPKGSSKISHYTDTPKFSSLGQVGPPEAVKAMVKASDFFAGPLVVQQKKFPWGKRHWEVYHSPGSFQPHSVCWLEWLDLFPDLSRCIDSLWKMGEMESNRYS